jgi:hypothetical protein
MNIAPNLGKIAFLLFIRTVVCVVFFLFKILDLCEKPLDLKENFTCKSDR